MILTKEILEKHASYYYPENFNTHNWMEVSAAFDELEHKQIENPRDLLSLLYQVSELMTLLNEEYTELYFKTISNSNDLDASRQLQDFSRIVMYPAGKRNEVIIRKYFDNPMRLQLNQDSYRQVNRFFEEIQADFNKDLSPENIEITKLIQEYKTAYNKVEIKLGDKVYPLNIISHMMSKAAPQDREAIWQARNSCCCQNKQQFADILDRLVKARNRMAVEYGYKNFYEYSLDTDMMGRIGLSQIQEIHRAISKVILPMVRLFIKQRQKRLGLLTIKPWELEADPEVASLSPFSHKGACGKCHHNPV